MKSEFAHERQETTNHNYSAIVVLAYASGPRGEKGAHSKSEKERLKKPGSADSTEYGPSYETKLVALAAAEAYKQGMAPEIIVLGEQTFQDNPEKNKTFGSTNLTTGKFIQEVLERAGVPNNIIKIKTPFNNTYLQLEELGKIQNPNNEYLVLGMDFHLPRVQNIIKRQNIHGVTGSAEILLQERYKKHPNQISELLANWRKNPQIQAALKTEGLIRVINQVDFKGLIQKFLTKSRGPRPPLQHQIK